MIIRPANPRTAHPHNPNIQVRQGGPHAQTAPLPKSPPSRIVNRSPTFISRPSSEYMLHLVPQQSQLTHPVPNLAVRPSHYSSAIHFVHDNKSNRSISLSKSRQDVQNLKMESTATRSINISENSNQKSQLSEAHKQAYFCPPSPLHLRKMETVRRVSQQKVEASPKSEEKSNKSKSQHNIHITIESNIATNADQPAPKITVSHIQHSPIKKQSVSILQTPPQIIQRHLINNYTPVVVEQAQIIRGQLLSREPSLSNKFQMINIPGKQVEQRQKMNMYANEQWIERKHSLSMDSKQIVRPKTYNSHQTSSSGFKVPSNIVINEPSNIEKQQPVSFNIQASEKIQKDKSSTNQFDFVKEPEERLRQQSQMTERKQIQRDNEAGERAEQVRVPYKEVYNEYYQQVEEQIQTSRRKEDSTKYGFMLRHQLTGNSRLLINQIFQNETNKALLKMRSLERRSRGTSLKRSKF